MKVGLLGAVHTPSPSAVRNIASRASLHLMTPKPVDWFKALPADGEMYGNNLYGDCWEVAQAWVICLRRAIVAGNFSRPDQTAILGQYQKLTGFNSFTGANDDGTDTSKGMADWCGIGIRVNSQTLDIPHWLKASPTDDDNVQLALNIAGPLMATWRLPMAMQDVDAWSKAPGTGSDWTAVWGEHETVLGAGDGKDIVFTRTWGMDLEVHPDIRRQFLIDIDVPLDLSPGGWLQTTGLTPIGLDRDAIIADMAYLRRIGQ